MISGDQLRQLGIGRGAIAHRRATGRLFRLHEGVFLVGGPALAPLAAEVAALLACGAASVLGDATAAWMWELRPAPPPAVHVVLPGVHRRRLSGVVVHTTSPLGGADIRIRSGLAVTAPARTLIDIAASSDQRAADRTVEAALARQLVSTTEIDAALRRAGSRRGVGRVRRALDQIAGGPAITRSEAERRLIALVRRARVPSPEANSRVCGFEVDLAWPAQRLIVEVDGYEFHGTRSAFERDRRRDADLLAQGWRVIRLTSRRIVDEPEAVISLLAGALAQRTS